MNASGEPRSLLPRRSNFVALALCSCSLWLLNGCHKATEAECEQILDRIVELELKDQGITDPEVVRKRAEETKAKKREALVKSCVGKRVGASNMECIRKAQSADEITGKCLR